MCLNDGLSKRDLQESKCCIHNIQILSAPLCVGAIISSPSPDPSHFTFGPPRSVFAPQFYFPAAAAIQEGLYCTPSCEYRDYVTKGEFTHIAAPSVSCKVPKTSWKHFLKSTQSCAILILKHFVTLPWKHL